MKKGIDPLIYDVPEDHDPSDLAAARNLVGSPGLPVGIIYQDTSRPSFDQRMKQIEESVNIKSVEQLMDTYKVA